MAWQKASPKQKTLRPLVRLGPGHRDGHLPYVFAMITESGGPVFHVTTRVCVPMAEPRAAIPRFDGRNIGWFQKIGEARTAGTLALSEDSATLRKEIGSGNANSTPAPSQEAPG